MRARRVLPFALLALALWVNAPFLTGWLAGPSSVADGAEPEPEPLADAATPPAPAVELAPTFAPVVVVDGLVDPFLRAGALPRSAAATTRLLPVVSLVLCTAGSRRAVLDGRIVGVGDVVDAGTVTGIEPRRVTLRTHDGVALELPLAAAAVPANPRPAADDEPRPDEERR